MQIRRLFPLLVLISGCAKPRTPAETRALLIGNWETVSSNEFELPHVFTDSTVYCEEFGLSGKYIISDYDSITIFGVDTLKGKLSFPEGDNTLLISSREWHVRMHKLLDPVR